jgi:hypothetical protein
MVSRRQPPSAGAPNFGPAQLMHMCQALMGTDCYSRSLPMMQEMAGSDSVVVILLGVPEAETRAPTSPSRIVGRGRIGGNDE